MNLFKRMFGEWVLVRSHTITATKTILCKWDVDFQAELIIEKNTKTGKRRAVLESIDGSREKVSLIYAEKVLSNCN